MADKKDEVAPWDSHTDEGAPWKKYEQFDPYRQHVENSDPHALIHAIAPTAFSTGAALLAPETLGASMALRGAAAAAGQGVNESIDRIMGWNKNDEDLAKTAAKVITHGATGALMAPADKYVVNPLLKKLGTKLYGAAIPSVVHEGEKYGKDEVTDELIKAGAWNPFSMPDKAKASARALTKERNAIFDEAKSLGAQGDMQLAMDPTISRIQKMGDDPAKKKAIDSGIRWVRNYLAMRNKSPTPQELSDLATSYDNNVASQRLFGIPKPGAQEEIEKSIMRGLKDESIRATDTVLPGKGQAVKELNQRMGRLLSTLPTQTSVSQGADRAASGGAVKALKDLAVGRPDAALLSAARTAAQSLTMPSGYLMVKSSEYPSLLTNYAAQVGASALDDRLNPWSLLKKDERK